MYFQNLIYLLLITFLAFPYREANAQESCDECKSFVKNLNKIEDTDECRNSCKKDQNKGKFTLEPKCDKKCCKEICKDKNKDKKPLKTCEKQDYCVSCKDDPEFQLKGDPEKDCAYIAENIEVRCPKKGAEEGCPATCNPECAPPVPSSAPTIDCTNDPEFQLKGDPEKDCAYIAEDIEVRCPKKGAEEGCPATCNPECATPVPTSAPSTTSAPSSFILSDAVCEEKVLQCLPCVERGCFFKGANGNGCCEDCRPIKSKCDYFTGYCVGLTIKQKDLCEERYKEGCERYL